MFDHVFAQTRILAKHIITYHMLFWNQITANVPCFFDDMVFIHAILYSNVRVLSSGLKVGLPEGR